MALGQQQQQRRRRRRRNRAVNRNTYNTTNYYGVLAKNRVEGTIHGQHPGDPGTVVHTSDGGTATVGEDGNLYHDDGSVHSTRDQYTGQGSTTGSGGGSGSSGGGGGGGGSGGSGGPYVTPDDVELGEPSLVDYKRMRAAGYTMIDPMEFASRFGAFNREEMLKNFELAKRFGMEQLEQELIGLEKFAPAAAALKRQQTSLDNIFNQMERSAQVDWALPGVREQLTAQGERAETYAEGRLPDAVQDAALSIGTRSRAADAATAGGFGATSSVAKKTSELMSAEQRLGVANYGEQLLSGNIAAKGNLLLAPTEYSNAGQQISVMPEVGAGRLTAQALGNINAATMLSPATALSASVQQQQFKTSLVQRTREFNKSARLKVDMFNAQTKNQFKMAEFGYEVAQAGIAAGVESANNAVALELAQQAQYGEIFSSFVQQAQNAAQTQAITSGISEMMTAGSGLINSIAGITGADVRQDGAPGGRGDGASGGESPVPGMPVDGGGSDHGISGGTNYPSADSVPDTHTGIQSNPDGTVTAIPNDQYKAQTSGFSNSTNIPLGQSGSPSTKELLSGKDVMLQTSGISRIPSDGSQPIGVNESGHKMYSKRAALESSDSSAGSRLVDGLTAILDPTGAFSQEERGTLEQISTVANNAALIAELTDAYQRGDKKGFIDTVLKALKQPLINQLAKDPQNKAGMQAAFNAYAMFAHWDKMSPAQKGLALAATGIQALRFKDGTNLAEKAIIKPTMKPDGKGVLKPGLTVGDALNLFATGYNVYSMIDNWDQLNNLQKITYGTANLSQMANLAKRYNMLGTGVTGAEVAISAPQLAAQGYTAAPAYGVGAAVGPSNAVVPKGYTVVAEIGKDVVIAPAGSAASAEGAISSNAGFLGGTAAPVTGVGSGAEAIGYETLADGSIGYRMSDGTIVPGASGDQTGMLGRLGQGVAILSIAMGAKQIYDGWGTGGKEGAINAGIGGSAIAAGLYTLNVIGPWGVAAVIAVSALSGLIKTGKHEGQVMRDGVRNDLEQKGLLGKEGGSHYVTLADGTRADMGADGNSGLHDVTNPDRLGGDVHRGDGKLHSYDVDYTNDLDYVANMGTNSLVTLLYGGHGDATDKMGGQLANASISQIGYGQEMTEENFNKMRDNVRSFYAQSGITSKSDAYQLANMAYAEGRIDESQLITAHQGINVMFDDDGYLQAQKLMGGRDRGAEVAAENVSAEADKPADNSNIGGKKPPEVHGKPEDLDLPPGVKAAVGGADDKIAQGAIDATAEGRGFDRSGGNLGAAAGRGGFISGEYLPGQAAAMGLGDLVRGGLYGNNRGQAADLAGQAANLAGETGDVAQGRGPVAEGSGAAWGGINNPVGYQAGPVDISRANRRGTYAPDPGELPRTRIEEDLRPMSMAKEDVRNLNRRRYNEELTLA